MTVEQAIARFQSSDLVEFAEPVYYIWPAAEPNDPYFLNGTQWSLPKIKAPEAWDIRYDASRVIVAVIDGGVRYDHEDLKDNMWMNPYEIMNGLDDDGNGYVDDIHGINAVNGSGNPMDDRPDGHGTHVAGIIGAKGNNSKGIAGVAWNVQIMALKMFGVWFALCR